MTFSKRYFYIFLFFLTILVFIFSCDKGKSENESQVIQENLPLHPEEKIEEKTEPPICYMLDSLENSSSIDSFRTKYTQEQQKVILGLNRLDPDRLKEGLRLIVPDSVHFDFLYFSPFPAHLEILDSLPKTVLINQRIQGIALYEHGKLIRWGPVSSGKKSTPTPNGLFYGNHKAEKKVSTVNPNWLLPYYFNYMNFYGVGVHQYTLPGFPASHACVRLYMDDAKFIYNWADQWRLHANGRDLIQNGTPFMVIGDYNFDGPAPWLDLVNDPLANNLTKEELDTIRSYVKEYYKEERNFPEKKDKRSGI